MNFNCTRKRLCQQCEKEFESDTKEVFNKIADFLVSVLPNLPEILPSEYVKYS